MIEKVLSKNGISIRLTDERWAHITEEHCELAGMRLEILDTVENPLRILARNSGEFLAVQEISNGKFLIVVYRESESDSFIITAFLTKRLSTLDRRKQLWPN